MTSTIITDSFIDVFLKWVGLFKDRSCFVQLGRFLSLCLFLYWQLLPILEIVGKISICKHLKGLQEILSHVGTVSIKWDNEWKEPSTVPGPSKYLLSLLSLTLLRLWCYVTDKSLQTMFLFVLFCFFKDSKQLPLSAKALKMENEMIFVVHWYVSGRTCEESRENKW